MYYTGCDAHKRSCTLQHIDDDGALGLSMKLDSNPKELDKFFDELDAPTKITFEASRGYWWLYQYFENHPKVSEVSIVDPYRSRKIAEELSAIKGYGRAKNDRIDTEMLAEQSRLGLARSIAIPSAEQLQQRTVSRHRIQLKRRNKVAANLIHSTLAMHGHSISIKELTDNENSRLQLFENIPEYIQFIIEQYIAQIQLAKNQIKQADKLLEQILPQTHPQIKLIMTAPGFGPICSRIVYTEIFDIAHFKAPKSLINYSGLAPVEQESDGRKGTIKLNRRCNYYLKYAFFTAAHAARTHHRYRRKYEQDIKKHGKIQAKLILARRLAKAVYWMLNRQQPFKF